MTADATEQQLRYYLSELAYLQSAAGEFARRHPAVAAQLELDGQGSADPHIERLLESFAFLTARLQQKIDGQLPLIARSLLETLYPQLAAPVPSMAIAQFVADPEQSRALSGFTLPPSLPVYATTDRGNSCRFRTAYPVTLWPLEVVEASFVRPAAYEFLNDRLDVATILRVRVGCCGHRTLGEFRPSSLRFYIDASPPVSTSLYELLVNRTRAVAVSGAAVEPAKADGQIGGRLTLLPTRCVQPVGFAADEAILPYPAQAHDGYRLLQEYFSFPEKFLFIDIEGLEAAGQLDGGRYFDLLFLLSEAPRRDLMIGRTTFALGCTPIINLFRKIAEPIRIDETELSYRLVADARSETCTEIHSILKVTLTEADGGEPVEVCPYFKFSDAAFAHEPRIFWSARREAAARADLAGTDVWLSFVDRAFAADAPPGRVAFAHVLCTNRGLVDLMPAGTPLEIEIDAPIRGARCLNKPSRQSPPRPAGASLWQAVSQLSLNYLSLTDGADSLAALREILSLYAVPDNAAVAKQISGLVDLSTRRIVRRIGDDAWRGFCRGTEVRLTVDEQQFTGAGAFLLGAVLSHFLSLYVAIDSFTQLVLTSRQRDGVWKTWPPLAGEGIVL